MIPPSEVESIEYNASPSSLMQEATTPLARQSIQNLNLDSSINELLHDDVKALSDTASESKSDETLETAFDRDLPNPYDLIKKWARARNFEEIKDERSRFTAKRSWRVRKKVKLLKRHAPVRYHHLFRHKTLEETVSMLKMAKPIQFTHQQEIDRAKYQRRKEKGTIYIPLSRRKEKEHQSKAKVSRPNVDEVETSSQQARASRVRYQSQDGVQQSPFQRRRKMKSMNEIIRETRPSSLTSSRQAKKRRLILLCE